jgi:hypothetical protein
VATVTFARRTEKVQWHRVAPAFSVLLTRRMCSLFIAVLVLLISDLTYARPIPLPIQPTTEVFAYQIPSRVRRNSAFSGPLSSNRTACCKHEVSLQRRKVLYSRPQQQILTQNKKLHCCTLEYLMALYQVQGFVASNDTRG